MSGYKDIINEKLKNKELFITMSDNSKWSIPVFIIVTNKANYYAGKDKNNLDVLKEKIDKVIELFNSDTYEIEDWAINNMNWSDVCDYAELVRSESIDYDSEWVSGEIEFK